MFFVKKKIVPEDESYYCMLSVTLLEIAKTLWDCSLSDKITLTVAYNVACRGSEFHCRSVIEGVPRSQQLEMTGDTLLRLEKLWHPTYVDLFEYQLTAQKTKYYI